MDNALSIQDGNGVTVFQINTNGTIVWRPQGSLTLVPAMPQDLPLAFALCVEMMSSPYEPLMNEVKKNAVLDKAEAIGQGVADYLEDIQLTAPEHKEIHKKNVQTIIKRLYER